MQDNAQLLELLSVAGFHSGTEMGDALGISRVAVQKRIHNLIEQGLPVQIVHGKGYRIEPGVILLDSKKIDAFWQDDIRALVERLEILPRVDSTSAYLAPKKIPVSQARVCVAEAQTQGRGRRGNEWHALPYRNVMLSLGWRFPRWPETITGLGLASSLVIAEQLNAQFDLSVEIKWPNDLLVEGDKIAGVLIDVSGEAGGECQVIVGIGLNVYQPAESRKQSDYQWRDLTSLGCQPNRNQLVALIVETWLRLFEDYSKHGFSPYVERWNKLSSYADQMVRVILGDKEIIGEMCGVDQMGALLLRDKNGEIQRITDSLASVRIV